MTDNNEKINFEPPISVKVGQIQFVEACHPPLVAGQYTVSMSQDIKQSENAIVPWNTNPYTSTLEFSVDAPRFTLGPADIRSVYPPANQSGQFDNALPHVVFTRRTLPWERTLDGRSPEWGKAFPPWLGLLLVEEDELRIVDNEGRATGKSRQVKSLPVVDTSKDSFLLPSDKLTILAPDLGQNPDSENWKKDKWDKEQGFYEKKSCLAIDLPVELFKTLAPRIDDLPYLAHVRQVDTGDKEVLGINDKGWFSLVMGNRVPCADKTHRAFLLSLEGHEQRLQESWQPAHKQMIRLAVLGSWGFSCKGSNNFKHYMQQLNFDRDTPLPDTSDSPQHLPDSWLHLPCEKSEDNTLQAEDIVNAAYSRGYTACNHAMRQGEKTVSWFRGPLVPLNYDKPIQIQEPVSCADELLRYDPNTGMFDVSYAAAWQLGRLLALQNQGFALALNRVRRTLKATAESLLREAELKALRKQLQLAEEGSIEDSLVNHIANAKDFFNDIS
jgi:hypothetical protein